MREQERWRKVSGVICDESVSKNEMIGEEDCGESCYGVGLEQVGPNPGLEGRPPSSFPETLL